VDKDKRKISLGLKQLLASPWDNIEEKYHHGKIVAGKVTKLMEFGAFVELEPGIEGLIHISELAPQRVRRVGDIVQQGQEVQVMILNVDPEQKRISLSLKAAIPEEVAAEEEESETALPESAKPRVTPLRGGIGDDWSLQQDDE
jgi:ribosomal protein S1